MVKYVDILLSATKILKSNFPNYNIYIDENQKQISKPSFYVKLVPLTNNNVLSNKRMKLLNVYITYVNRTSYQEEYLDIIDDLVEAFDGIQIETNTVSRYLPIVNRDVVKGDSITLKLTFKFLDDKREPFKEDTNSSYSELMKILALNVEIEENDINQDE